MRGCGFSTFCPRILAKPTQKGEKLCYFACAYLFNPMESIQTDSTIEIAIVETPYVQIQNTKFPTRKKYRFPEFNLLMGHELI